MNIKKGGTFRATTAANNGNGRNVGQVKHINANNFVPSNKNRNEMNNTHYVNPGNKNILIHVLNEKKSPRPPISVNKNVHTRKYKADLNKSG